MKSNNNILVYQQPVIGFKEQVITRSTKLIWTGKGKLYEFVDILYQKKYIISKREIFSFFIKPCNGSKIRWNPDYKYHLAYLLFILCRENFIILSGSKGFYTCAEKHFTDIEGIFLKKNSLKNIKLKIINNPDKFSFVIREIDEIITKISMFKIDY
ncbi:MAG: hypothetical protein V1904_00585 [Bacteroidota bacterium]